jgi:tRNA dimethylallyltransferase
MMAKEHPTLQMRTSKKRTCVAIVGPTGVGKSALALHLARALAPALAVEIVSADSRQIYRGMDIGTAKPTPAELAQAPHHLIDILSPDQAFSLAEYQERAYAAIDDILDRGRLPMLVGGTGQYVRAVVEGWRIPRVAPDPELRAALQAEADRDGHMALYQRLLDVDPAAAEFVDARNVRRVIRALEVCFHSGRPFSEQRGRDPPPYAILTIGLTMEREALYRRVDARVDRMIAQGLVDEVRALAEDGYDWTLPAMSSLGYAQLRGYLEGSASLDECVAAIMRDTRRFIRQQYNWFRLDNPQIHWFDADDSSAARTRCAALEWIRKELGIDPAGCPRAL